MLLVHHNDLDGRCAGHIVVDFWQDQYPQELAQPLEMDYEEPFPFDLAEKHEWIWIVDFSLEPEDMSKLVNMGKSIVWIDHHKSAIGKYAQSPLSEIEGVRDPEKAACVLTYKYWYEGRYGKPCRYVPKYIRLIGDRDTWAWEYGDHTRNFCNGLLAEDTSPTSDIWKAVQKSTVQIEKNGVPIGRAMKNIAEQTIRQHGFETDFHKYSCYAVNTSFFRTSTYFEPMVPDYDIWIVFNYTSNSWAVRMYSKKVDVSKMAEKYTYNGRRGGGHKNAAGFQCAWPPFLASSSASRARRRG